MFMNDFLVLPVHKSANKNNKKVEYFLAVQKSSILFSSESEASKFARKQRIVSGDMLPISTITVTTFSSFFIFFGAKKKI